MEVANYHLLFMTIFLVFEYNCYPDLIEVIKLKATFLTEKYFWRGLGIIIVLIDIYYLHILVPKLNFLSNGGFCNFSNYNEAMNIYDIFKLSLFILFLHYYVKFFTYRREWVSYKWLENFIIVGSYIVVFIIVLMLSYLGLIIVPSTAFEKIAFFILIVVSYFAYYIACATDWLDEYIYSSCYTYTSTVNHIVLKGRKYLTLTDLAIRWRPKKTKKITQKKEEIVQSTPQDPIINKYLLVNKGLNDNHQSLKTSQSPDCESEYLQPTRIVRPNTYYDQPDKFAPSICPPRPSVPIAMDTEYHGRASVRSDRGR
ncbi:unnamed protein product [Aphis gossypii]|uniref:Uncharacterized protein n=1 Tax=Aphis gossypii TaxID=80765 RepID=A0A9P0NGU6_APHGO|nr:unnamed protein product [Aphis gossypii]